MPPIYVVIIYRNILMRFIMAPTVVVIPITTSTSITGTRAGARRAIAVTSSGVRCTRW